MTHPSDEPPLYVGAGELAVPESARVLRLSRAQPPPEVADLVVAIHVGGRGEVPEGGAIDSLHHNDALFDQEARALASALSSALPGGTFDRLVGHLLLYKASQLIVGRASLGQAFDSRSFTWSDLRRRISELETLASPGSLGLEVILDVDGRRTRLRGIYLQADGVLRLSDRG